MASLHKDPRGKSPFWYCAYVLPDGRRTFRSTKERDRKKAFDICRALEKASAKAREGELTEIQVRKLLDELLENVGQSPMRSESVASFFQSWLASKQASIGKSSFTQYTKAIATFLAGLGTKADKSLAGVTPGDITAFRDARLAEGVSAGTLAHDLKTIRSVFASARRQGRIQYNPTEEVDLPENRPHERDVFTAAEIQALLKEATQEWKTLILCGYFLGGRLSDMAALSWEATDLSSGVIFYRQSKTGGKVEIPIHPELEEHLLLIAKDQSGALCPTLASTRVNGRNGLSNQFSRLMTQAGIDRHQVKTSRNKFAGKSYHSLRHSFSSALANLGISAEVRMKLTGHKSLSVHQGYSHLELQPLRNAIAALPRLSP